MKKKYFVKLTVKVGYNCIKTMGYLVNNKLVDNLQSIHSTPDDNYIVIDFNSTPMLEQEFDTLIDTLGNKIELLIFSPI